MAQLISGTTTAFGTGTNNTFCIGSTSASNSGTTTGSSALVYAPYNAGGGAGLISANPTIPGFRVSITATTTYYLNAQAGYSSTTPTWTGGIFARRVR
jgi:hypothetical protein